MLNALDITDGDDLEFIEFSSNAFLLSKKSDILELIRQDKGRDEQAKPQPAPESRDNAPAAKEIAVLKKIDTLRYNERTRENVSKLLNAQEKETLSAMVKKGYLKPFRSKQGIEVYSISKSIYDNFLMRKAKAPELKKAGPEEVPKNERITYMVKSRDPENEYIKELMNNGFVVLASEIEASKVSMLVEQSIRSGEILGTRAFNKKFYIALRDYLNRYTPEIIKILKNGAAKTDDIAKKAGMDSEGTRAILYLLAENGDITEKRKDIFALA